jgi:phospholipase C
VSNRLSRRRFLALAGGATAGVLGGEALRSRAGAAPVAGRAAAAPGPPAAVGEALAALGRTTLRHPGSLPDPTKPAGTDTLPGIEQIVVLMMENHSYDNILGMLGRTPRHRPRGDGFILGRDGLPTATNPYPDGRIQHAFRMPTTCQLSGRPSQEWTASHVAYDNGGNDGFVRAPISYGSTAIVGGVAMGYWTGDDLPYTYALAGRFPIGDRWFSSALAQTDPNRRYLIAATSVGMVDDIGTSPGNGVPDAALAVPAAGTIFNQLDLHGISWVNYTASYPTGATPNLFPANDGASEALRYKPYSQFVQDAAAGRLPAFTLLDPDYGTESQENPQNIVRGERVIADAVTAVATGPQWRTTMLVITYDEHGGYYDHVPPPVALAPDAIPPLTQPGQSAYDGFARYGFRVPAIVVSPYAKRDHVSHVLYDHTSILAMVERKWNLPALTFRDANANDLLDFVDLEALRSRRPTFPTLPPLPAPGDTPARLACDVTGPGAVPPPGSISG